MSAASDNLERLKAAAALLPADLCDWVIEGIHAWERGDSPHLEHGLGLVKSGKESIPYKARQETRNSFLRMAADCIESPHGREWPRYEAVAAAIRRYQTRGHATGKRGDKLDTFINSANDVGIGLPTTAGGVYAALRKFQD